MIDHVMPLGPFLTNTVILGCETTKEGVVVDPGFEGPTILAKVEELGLQITAILLTHGHVDHVSAVKEIKEATGAPVHIHPEDEELYKSAPMLGRYFGLDAPEPPDVDHRLSDGDTIRFGEHELRVLHTPGHSPGGVGFHCAAERLLLAGDTIFYRSIGRTDLPGGSMAVLTSSIRDKIFTLDDETRIITGHGPDTSVADERAQNPFVGL